MLSGISVLVWYGNLIIFQWEYSTKALENKIVHTNDLSQMRKKKQINNGMGFTAVLYPSFAD